MKKFTVLMLCFGFLAANATSWRVNNNPAIDADFSDLTTAIATANEGDTLYIEGTQFYYDDPNGTITLDKKLVLIGPGYFLDQNDSTQVNYNSAKIDKLIVDQSAMGCEIYGLYIHGTVDINADNVIFARNRNAAIQVTEYVNLGNVSNCVITQNHLNKLRSYSYALNILITNNFISKSLHLDDDCSATIFNNVVGREITADNSVVKNNILWDDYYNSGYAGSNSVFEYNIANVQDDPMPPGVGNISGIDPNDVFVDYDGSLGYSEDAKWQLKESSIAIGYGENGVDCGMFGGTSPYVLSGLPAVPHIYEAIVPTSGSAASGLPVIIKVKSQN